MKKAVRDGNEENEFDGDDRSKKKYWCIPKQRSSN